MSDVVAPLMMDPGTLPVSPPELTFVRRAETLVVVAAWLAMKYARLSLRQARWVELGTTVFVVFAYAFVGNLYQPSSATWYGTVYSFFGVLLLLALRSALIPSSVLRTLMVGSLSLLTYTLVAREQLGALEPAALEGLSFLGLAYVLVIAVASHVIYGLRREVRDAKELGQYVLEKRIGKGGMGEVYLAHHRLLRRTTAVKLLPAAATSESAVARFETEVQLTAELTHPHTIRIFDYGRTDDGVFYYAMEHLKGATLLDVVTVDGAQPVSRIIKILVEACGALEEAHEAGLIHRDIKPANLMLTKQGMDQDALKVLDFGLVYRIDRGEDPGVTQEGALVGTPLYMAPEVIKKAEASSAASDLYALGAVAYYLATGTDLFTGDSIIEICSQHLHATAEPPSERLGSALPEDFEAIVLRCLEKDPEARFASVKELETALIGCRDHGRWSDEDAARWWATRGEAVRALQEGQEMSPRALTVVGAAAPSR
ncbi:MAG: serine/threonine-protein kinase [Myxococcota bacterium]